MLKSLLPPAQRRTLILEQAKGVPLVMPMDAIAATCLQQPPGSPCHRNWRLVSHYMEQLQLIERYRTRRMKGDKARMNERIDHLLELQTNNPELMSCIQPDLFG